jgi:ligand-binding sensor domain-containing protein
MCAVKHNTILLALLFCLSSSLFAGEQLLPVYNFIKIQEISQKVEGLSTEAIRTRVVRDNKGFIWIGTVFGLIRYDGYSVNAYRHDPKDPYSISSNIIQSLFVDSKNRLWVGTHDTGLSLYDATHNRFINFLPRKGDSLWLQSKCINGMMEDLSGSIWLATQGVVQVEIPVTDESSTIDSLVQAIRFTTFPLGTPYIETYNLIQQDDSRFLIASDSGLVILNPDSTKTSRLQFTDQLNYHPLQCIRKDLRGNVWLGSANGNGLFRLDREAKKLWNYRYKIDNNSSIISDIIYDLAEDNDGNIWICSKGGVHLFSPALGKYLPYLTYNRALTKQSVLTKISVDYTGTIRNTLSD